MENEDIVRRIQGDMPKVLRNEPIQPRSSPMKLPVNEYSSSERTGDLSKEDLIRLLAPFLDAYSLLNEERNIARRYFAFFIDTCLSLGIFDASEDDSELSASWQTHSTHCVDRGVDLAGVWGRIFRGEHRRDDRILLYRITSSFQSLYIDWDVRDTLLKLLRYAVGKAMILYNKAREEEFLSRNPVAQNPVAPNDAPRNMKIYWVDKDFSRRKKEPGRRDLLSRENTPALTLDEFADLVVRMMEEKEGPGARAPRDGYDEMYPASQENRYNGELQSEEERRRKAIAQDNMRDSVPRENGDVRRLG